MKATEEAPVEQKVELRHGPIDRLYVVLNIAKEAAAHAQAALAEAQVAVDKAEEQLLADAKAAEAAATKAAKDEQ